MPKPRQLGCVLVFAGALIAPAPALAAGWVYTESNNPAPGRNSVLALHYGSTGALNPIRVREFLTHGTGAPLILGKSAGTLAGDQEVQVSPNKKWLFAVNEGSNTVAVFKLNKNTGDLTSVAGSPFPSGGVAPISVGYSGGRLVVANHGQIAPFDPAGMTPPGPSSFVSFSVSKTGKLKQIATLAESHEGLITAAISPSGTDVFSTGFYSQKIHSVTLSKTGALAEAPGSPTQFPASMNAGIMLPPFLPASLIPLPFGIGVNPIHPYMYVLGPLNQRVAIYKYAADGSLTFTGQAENPGALAQCWAVVSKDGRYMYTANSAAQDISLFKVSANGAGLTFVEHAKVPSTGTVRELAFDPTDKYLYAVAGHDDPDAPRPQGILPNGTIVDAPADGNFIDAYSVGAGGKLTSISSTPLPVRFSAAPFGLATVRKGG